MDSIFGTSVLNYFDFKRLGFGFKGKLKCPFDLCVDFMIGSRIPIISVDCPTGWTSEEATDLQPEMLISLTAPKECSKFFNGKLHILGGRFIPDKLPEKYEKLKYINQSYRSSDLFTELKSIDNFK